MDDRKIMIRNKDLIWLLEIVLESCNKLAELDVTKREHILCELAQTNNFESGKNHFADGLCLMFFNAHKNVKNGKVCPRIGEEEFPELEVETKFTTLDFLPMDRNNESEQLEELQWELERSFLPKKKIKEIQEKIKAFLNIRKQIVSSQIPFPSFLQTEIYLRNYYHLMTYLMINEELMRPSDTMTYLLHLLLSLDMEKEAASILCPMGMNALRKMYLGIEEYYRQITENKKKDKTLRLFYQNVIIRKTQHSFRWYTCRNDRKLYHAAISPFVQEFQHEGNLLVKIRSLEEYNSFEGIGEHRIGEKILYEIKKQRNRSLKTEKQIPDNFEEFKIAVLGDIDKEPMQELIDYVEKVLKEEKEPDGKSQKAVKIPQLFYEVYSKNFSSDECKGEWEEEQNARICYHNELDGIFSDSEKIKKLLEDNHMIFMLDCIKLYQPIEFQASGNINIQKQRFAFGDFSDSSTIEKIDLCAPNLMEKLYEMALAYNQQGIFGLMRKRANDPLLEFCEKQIQGMCGETERNHTLYVYVSDLRAFENVYCNDEYFMRTECYNQKEIGIIRYTNFNTEKKSLPEETEGNYCRSQECDFGPMICFNVWQIVKHINLEKRREIISQINLMEEEIQVHELQKLYIGIDYRNWSEQLILHYGIKDRESDLREHNKSLYKFLQEFTKRIVLPVFNDDRNNLFQQYFWRTMYSLLYGDSKSVQDMLLIYLLHEKPEKIGKAVIAKKAHNNEGEVIENINKNYKYSIKRFYEKIMRGYDISASDSLDQNWTAYIIGKNKEMEDTKADMFRKVVIACEKLGYKDSYLYKNCKRVLEIN